jgi:hypothetical protein
MHDVFLSHSSQDKAFADRACAAIEAAGFKVWIAPRDVDAGRPYSECIVKAISDCALMVVVLSANSNGSDHVVREVESASNKRKPVLPIQIDQTPPKESLQYYLGPQHRLMATGGDEREHLAKLAEEVAKIVARQAPRRTGGSGPEGDRSADQERRGERGNTRAGAGGRGSGSDADRRLRLALPIAAGVCAAAGVGVWLSGGGARLFGGGGGGGGGGGIFPPIANPNTPSPPKGSDPTKTGDPKGGPLATPSESSGETAKKPEAGKGEVPTPPVAEPLATKMSVEELAAAVRAAVPLAQAQVAAIDKERVSLQAMVATPAEREDVLRRIGPMAGRVTERVEVDARGVARLVVAALKAEQVAGATAEPRGGPPAGPAEWVMVRYKASADAGVAAKVRAIVAKYALKSDTIRVTEDP